MTLGQNIQNARRAQGLSQEALAEKIGVSRQALGKWEKDTALPGLDNLQALAAALGIGVDALLGAENADPAVPAVTLDALRDLLAARDAEEKRRRRLWGCAGGAAFIVLAGLLAGVALQYERQISALNQNYAAIQSSYAAQQAELSAQISELQDAVRMGEATILDWRWLPVDKLHRDADKSWMPVQVQVTPRTVQDGMTITASDLGYGYKMNVQVRYTDWPTQLAEEYSADNLPSDYDHYVDVPCEHFEDDTGDAIVGMMVMIFVVIFIIVLISAVRRGSGYAGGFGTRYVFVNHLWYPAGPDGRPRPRSVGPKTKPRPPRSGGGGFGGGSRGGGFGGGGFSGGSHCACASSCACACACACAGGGRAGCSAKNLYGVKLDEKLAEKM